MGYRVDLSEVMEFSDDFYSYVNRVIDQLTNVRAQIQNILNMESFQGDSADRAKECLRDFHLEMLKNFEHLMVDLIDNVDSHIDTFLTEVDGNDSAIVESDYLEEQDEVIQEDFMKMVRLQSDADQTIQSVSDISSATSPDFSNIVHDKAETAKAIQRLDDHLSTFVSTGKGRLEKLDATLNDMNSLIKNGANATENGSLAVTDQLKENASSINKGLHALAQTRSFYSGYKIKKAYDEGKLSTVEHKDMRTGKASYRVYANKDALDQLGVTPDHRAKSELNHRLPKNGRNWRASDYKRSVTNQTVLKAADRRGPFRTQWTGTGQQTLRMHPEMRYWREEVNVKHVASSTVKGAAKGAYSGFTDSLKLYEKNQGFVKGFSKSMGAAGIGLNYYSNYHDAKEDGLTGKEAVARATQDTVVDTAVGGAVQAGLTALGTAAIPIPGVGTAVGALAGIGANWVLNKKFGKGDKSVMDRIKGWFH